MAFLPALRLLAGRFNLFATRGFLPAEFRTQMRLSWTARQQRRFEWLLAALRLTGSFRGDVWILGYQLYMRDMRARRAAGSASCKSPRRSPSMSFPSLNHVAVTVRDLEVSEPWYRRLIGADPALDEDTDAGYHHTMGFRQRHTVRNPSARGPPTAPSPSLRPGWTTSPSDVGAAASLRSGWNGWTASESNTVGSSMRTTALGWSFRDPDGITLEFFAPPS